MKFRFGKSCVQAGEHPPQPVWFTQHLTHFAWDISRMSRSAKLQHSLRKSACSILPKAEGSGNYGRTAGTEPGNPAG